MFYHQKLFSLRDLNNHDCKGGFKTQYVIIFVSLALTFKKKKNH